MAERQLLIQHYTALGDTVVLSALIRDLKQQFGDRFELDVDTNCPQVWAHNPHLTRFDRNAPTVEKVKLEYNHALRSANNGERKHFLTAFFHDFTRHMGLVAPVRKPHGDLHLSPAEQAPLISGRYWVVFGGGKTDCPLKCWGSDRLQSVIDILHPMGFRFVQVGAIGHNQYSQPLQRVLNLVGRTSIRDLFRLIAQADGVLCGVTSGMHIAAAFQRPCVVFAGGREAPWWEAYVNNYPSFGEASGQVRPPHKFLHTLGLLDCCKDRGCWRLKVVAHNALKDERPCHRPIFSPGKEPRPECMEMIQVEHVLEAMMAYYSEGELPPIGSPKKPWLNPAPALPANSQSAPTRLPVDSQSTPSQLPLASQSTPIGGFLRLPGGPPPKASPPPKPINAPVSVREPTLSGDLEGDRRFANGPPRVQEAPPTAPASQLDSDIFDNPIIGGKFTIFALCYGQQYEMLHRRCLDSILASVPAHRMDLRVATNECGLNTLNYLNHLAIGKRYDSPNNRMKYPVMREMFHDPQAPIETNYVIWFDDDSYVVNPLWLSQLAQTIISNHPHGNRLYGIKFFHKLMANPAGGVDQTQFFRSGSWYRHKPFRTSQGDPSPNGDTIHFVSGGFWALGVDALRECDIPDPRLFHNGGDITIGEQVNQGGYGIKMFNNDKQFVFSSGADRRGFHEKFPWHR